MKKLLAILCLALFHSGCEDVIDVDLPDTAPRLSIDALIEIDNSEEVTTVQIKASLSSSFFEDNTPALLTSISIINPEYTPSSALDSTALTLSQVSPGIYEGSKVTRFFTEGELQLLIEHDDQRYLALTTYVPSTPILELTQGEGNLFSGEETEIEVSFSDNGEREDFYLFNLDFEEYLVTEDEFYQGQTFQFSYFYDDGIDAGQEVNIRLLGVDEPFFNYMNQITVQAGGDQGPFQTPSATVRGNIINITNIDNINSFDNVNNPNNFALGYFAVCETYTKSIVIE